MKLVKLNQAEAFANSDKCKVVEYHALYTSLVSRTT